MLESGGSFRWVPPLGGVLCDRCPGPPSERAGLSLDALKLLTKNHINIFIVTNQSGIAKGYYTLKDYEKITAHMLGIFSANGIAVKEVLFCPHHVEGMVPEFTQKCQCRKPETGMIQKIIDKYGYKAQDLVLIGDKNSDILAGKSLGLKTLMV